MVKFLFFCLCLGGVFVGSYQLAERQKVLKKEIAVPRVSEGAFRPTPFPLKEHLFTIVIVGQNNGASVAKTLASVFSQVYESYKVIYIDDGSKDGSFDLARDLIYESEHLSKVTLVSNPERLGTLANICRAVQSCSDEEIVVVLHGEDWLAHEWVLQTLNRYYADPDLWITYGQYRDFPTYQLGISHPVAQKNWRKEPFTASHLKTFYAGLFKKVRESDFIYTGKHLPACAELAYMIPMLEMAKDHSHFIDEILYIHNRQVVKKEEREELLRSEKWIRSLDPYPPLVSLKVH